MQSLIYLKECSTVYDEETWSTLGWTNLEYNGEHISDNSNIFDDHPTFTTTLCEQMHTLKLHIQLQGNTLYIYYIIEIILCVTTPYYWNICRPNLSIFSISCFPLVDKAILISSLPWSPDTSSTQDAPREATIREVKDNHSHIYSYFYIPHLFFLCLSLNLFPKSVNLQYTTFPLA